MLQFATGRPGCCRSKAVLPFRHLGADISQGFPDIRHESSLMGGQLLPEQTAVGN